MENDYKNYDENIERMTAEELRRIQERINQIKKEAENVGETVERVFEKSDSEKGGEKS